MACAEGDGRLPDSDPAYQTAFSYLPDSRQGELTEIWGGPPMATGLRGLTSDECRDLAAQVDGVEAAVWLECCPSHCMFFSQCNQVTWAEANLPLGYDANDDRNDGQSLDLHLVATEPRPPVPLCEPEVAQCAADADCALLLSADPLDQHALVSNSFGFSYMSCLFSDNPCGTEMVACMASADCNALATSEADMLDIWANAEGNALMRCHTVDQDEECGATTADCMTDSTCGALVLTLHNATEQEVADSGWCVNPRCNPSVAHARYLPPPRVSAAVQ